MKTFRYLLLALACVLVMTSCPSPVRPPEPLSEEDVQEAVEEANEKSQNLLVDISEALTTGDFSGLQQFLTEEDRNGELEELLAQYGVTAAGRALARGFSAGDGPSAGDLQDGDTLLFRGDGSTWQNQLMRLVYPGYYHHAGTFDADLANLQDACVVSATIDAGENGLTFQTLEELNSTSSAAARLRYFQPLPAQIADSLAQYRLMTETAATSYAFVHLNLEPVSRFDDVLWYCSKVPWRVYWDAYQDASAKVDIENGAFYDDPDRFAEMKESLFYQVYYWFLRIRKLRAATATERADAKLRQILEELISPDELRGSARVSSFEYWGTDPEPEYFAAGNHAPVACFSHEPAEENLTVRFDASCSSDLDGTIISYEWDFGGGQTANGIIVEHLFSEAGEHSVALTVTDDGGAAVTVSRSITVVDEGNDAPVADFSFGPDPGNPRIVHFDASSSYDPDGSIVSYTWDFGDNSPAGDGRTTAHTYSVRGDYLVALTVEDDDGAQRTVGKTVTVEQAPEIGSSPSSTIGFLFSATQGGPNPAGQELTIWNAGGGTLTWTLTTNEDWLDVSAASGESDGLGDVTEVAVTVDIAGMSAGAHEATISIVAGGATNSPVELPVALSISDPALIGFSPDSFAFEGPHGGSAPAQYLEIRNDGGGTLDWEAEGDHSWIVLSPVSGSLPPGGTQLIKVGVDLSVGLGRNYASSIILSAPGAANSPVNIPVLLRVILAGLCVDGNHPAQNPTGANWDEAFAHPNDALAIALPGQEVWIADGTYLRQGTDSVLMTMTQGVDIYGGFGGWGEGETAVEQRHSREVTYGSGDYALTLTLYDQTGFETVLDGGGVVANVVRGADGATLNGVTVTGGDAKTSPWKGGGLYIFGCSPTVEHCKFIGNRANQQGGGIYCTAGAPSFAECIVEANTSGSSGGDGGGLAIVNAGAVQVTDVCFFDNNALESGRGGGLHSLASYPVITRCRFDGNIARYGGGGAAITEARSAGDLDPDLLDQVVVRDCALVSNQANTGGGLYWDISTVGTIRVEDNLFEDNTAVLYNGTGGGAHLENHGDIGLVPTEIVVEGNTFADNAAPHGGGAYAEAGLGNVEFCRNTLLNNTASASNGGGASVVSSGGDVFIRANTFGGNYSGTQGGGIHTHVPNGDTVYVNNLCYENQADVGGGFFISGFNTVVMYHNTLAFNALTPVVGGIQGGGGVRLSGGIYPADVSFYLVNNIFWGNTGLDGLASDIHKSSGGGIVLANNKLLEDGLWPDTIGIPLGNDTGADLPGFVDSASGDYRLAADSPCVNTGTSDSGVPTYPLPDDDRLGHTRPSGGAYDKGAYEYQQ